jgi:beta-glucosidase
VPILRSASSGARVGIVLNLTPGYPASGSAADAEATRSFDGGFNRWYLDPLFGRGYPEDMVREHTAAGHGEGFTFVHDGDLKTAAVPLDFLGINYYSRAIVRSSAVPEAQNEARTVHEPADSLRTDMGWEVYPDGLRTILERVQRDYAPPSILVTENGAAYAQGVGPDGRVDDGLRTAYLEGHLEACRQAIAAGVKLRGYFAWSLMDNFEWAWGYQKRFGLVHVDYETQKRTVKESGHWFARVARANALPEASK